MIHIRHDAVSVPKPHVPRKNLDCVEQSMRLRSVRVVLPGMTATRDPPTVVPLRILCFLHAVELGGVERAAMRLCRRWATRSQVTLALGRTAGWDGDENACRVRSAPANRFPAARLETLWMIWWLGRVIAEERPDVIFCAGNTYSVVAVAMRLRFGRRCPPIVAKLSNSLDRPDLPRVAQFFYRLWCRIQGLLIDRFVAMTAPMAKEALTALGVSPSRVAVVSSPAFDTAAHDRLVEAGRRGSTRWVEGRLFLAVGRLVRQKNFSLMIDAFAVAATGRDRLVILGDGAERAALARLIAARGLRDRVLLPGQREDVANWLAMADAVLLSSDYEGVPAIVLEAFAAGRPVIATECCVSMRDLLGDGRRGHLVPPRDVDAFAAALAAPPPPGFDPDEARAFARTHLADHAADRLLTLFHAVAYARRSPPVSSPFAQGATM